MPQVEARKNWRRGMGRPVRHGSLVSFFSRSWLPWTNNKSFHVSLSSFMTLTCCYRTGPIELLGLLSKGSMVQNSTNYPFVPYEFVIDYLAETMDPIVPVNGAPISPSKTFKEVN